MPQEVFVELSNPSITHIKRKVSELCLNGDITTKEILTDTDEYILFYELAISPPKGERRIGKGEAAAIALDSWKKANSRYGDLNCIDLLLPF